MNFDPATSAISPTMVRGCLVVPLPSDLAGELESLRALVLDGVRDRQARAVVFDFSAVQLLDCMEFQTVRDILSMAELLGAITVLCGLRPSVVAYLVWSDADTNGLTFARDLEEALEEALSAALPSSQPAAS